MFLKKTKRIIKLKNFGFVRVAAAVPFNNVAAIEQNTQEIIKQVHEAAG